jgi:hypothetical protein
MFYRAAAAYHGVRRRWLVHGFLVCPRHADAPRSGPAPALAKRCGELMHAHEHLGKIGTLAFVVASVPSTRVPGSSASRLGVA